MEVLLLIGILILNVLISIWNCYAVGTAWKDTMAIGGWFNKLVLWSAVIQSGVGFSMPILLMLSYGSVAFLTSGAEPTISPEMGAEFLQGVFSLWYVAVILPILGSGLAIWAHSLRVAYQRRDFASIAIAGWNTYAQIHNTISAVNHLGGALGNVGELFGKTLKADVKGSGKLWLLALVIVAVSLIGGFMIAIGLVRHFARKAESRIEQYAETLQKKTRYA